MVVGVEIEVFCDSRNAGQQRLSTPGNGGVYHASRR
jgi:hypothetical protein